MNRLVISDLHLGLDSSVAASPLALDRLGEELCWCDELVIAGDLLSLTAAPLDRCLAAGAPLLKVIAERVSSLVWVPGNHDFPLAQISLDEQTYLRAAGLPFDAGRLGAAERLLSMLLPAVAVRCVHPLARLDGVAVLHGHQHAAHVLSHMDVRQAADYDRLLGPLFMTLAAHADAGSPHPHMVAAARDLMRIPAGPHALRPMPDVVGAVSQVCDMMNVTETQIVFAHLHQMVDAFPHAGRRFYNPGSWMIDPYVMQHDPDPRSSWPGGALRLHADGRVELRRLLDDLSARQLAELAGGQANR